MTTVTFKVLEDRTFSEGRFLTLEIPEETPLKVERPELPTQEHRGSRASDFPDRPNSTAAAFTDLKAAVSEMEAAEVDDPQR